jgi:LysM repeat protein
MMICRVLVLGTAITGLLAAGVQTSTPRARPAVVTRTLAGSATRPLDTAVAHLATVRRLSAAAVHGSAAQPASRAYTVRPGDSLTSIAQRFYGSGSDWTGLYRVNRSRVANPEMIYPGQVLLIPHDRPAPMPATAAAPSTTLAASTSTSPAAGNSTTGNSTTGNSTTGNSTTGNSTTGNSTPSASASGTLGCSALEALWEHAGGSPAHAVVAASIAMAESSGQQYATGSAGERGYWQINPVNGALSTYDPYGNAHAAVVMSADGTNWSPWTTYTSGAYEGRC